MRKIYAFLIVSGLAPIASSSFALPSNEVERIYYSDATHSEAVGWETIMTCWGRPHGVTLEGKKTKFTETLSTPCDRRLNVEEPEEGVDFE